jgi:hypothetical protein
VAPSFFSLPHGKQSWPEAAARPSSGELHGWQLWPIHRGPRPALVHVPWTESTAIFPLKNKSENELSREICKEAPRFLCNQAAVHKNYEKTPGFQNISKNTPRYFPEIPKKIPATSFCHIFATVTPISVILAPKFSESLPLSSYALINTCLLHFID